MFCSMVSTFFSGICGSETADSAEHQMHAATTSFSARNVSSRHLRYVALHG